MGETSAAIPGVPGRIVRQDGYETETGQLCFPAAGEIELVQAGTVSTTPVEVS